MTLPPLMTRKGNLGDVCVRCPLLLRLNADVGPLLPPEYPAGCTGRRASGAYLSSGQFCSVACCTMAVATLVSGFPPKRQERRNDSMRTDTFIAIYTKLNCNCKISKINLFANAARLTFGRFRSVLVVVSFPGSFNTIPIVVEGLEIRPQVTKAVRSVDAIGDQCQNMIESLEGDGPLVP